MKANYQRFCLPMLLMFLLSTVVLDSMLLLAQGGAAVHLEGVVKDAQTGAIIPAAEISFAGAAALTDATGRFAIDIKNQDKQASMSVKKAGYADKVLAINLAAKPEIGPLTISLEQSGVISGKVLSSAGADAVGCGVYLFTYRSRYGRKELVIQKQSLADDRGEYRLFNLPAGSYLLAFGHVTPMTVAPTEKDKLPIAYPGVRNMDEAELVKVESGKETRVQNVYLPTREEPITVTFENPSNAAIDATYQITYETIQLGPYSGRSEYPKKLVSLLPHATQELKVWPATFGLLGIIARWKGSNGQTEVSSAFVDFRGTAETRQIVLAVPNGSVNIHGSIERPDGTVAPLSGSVEFGICSVKSTACQSTATWIARRADDFSGPIVPVLDSKGELRLTGVVPGTYELYSLRPIPDGFYIANARQGERNVLSDGLVINEEQSTPVVIQLRPKEASLQGTVPNFRTDGTWVGILPEPPFDKARLQYFRRATAVNQDGSFMIDNIIPGDYRIYAWTAGNIEAYLQPSFVEKYRDSGKVVHIGGDATLEISAVDRLP